MVLDAIELGLGAATSAADLTLAIVKLKQLWDEVKDVPNEIASILENLEAFGLMLQDLEARLRIDDIPPELRSRIVASPPQLFQRAYASLQDVIGSLNMELQKSNGSRRRFASIKIVLQKSTLQLLEKKLQQALQTFAWAIQIFQLSLMVKAEHMVARRLALPATASPGIGAATNSPETLKATKGTGTDDTHERSASRRKANARLSTALGTTVLFGCFEYTRISDEQYKLVIRPPSWLIGSVYVAMAEHSVQGWEVSLRTYCLIPKWAPIFDDELHMVFIEDDFSAVKRSLHTHGLPIWSQDMTGLSLLALATIYQSPKILRQLFKIGLKSTSDLVNYFAEHVLDLVGPESTNFITEIYLQLTQLYLLLDSAFTDLGKPQQRRLDTFHITSDYIPVNNLRYEAADLLIFTHLTYHTPYGTKPLLDYFFPRLPLAKRVRIARAVSLVQRELHLRVEEVTDLFPKTRPNTHSGSPRASLDFTEFNARECCLVLHLAARNLGLSHSTYVLQPDLDYWSETICNLLMRQDTELSSLELYDDYHGGRSSTPQTPFFTHLCAVLEAHQLDMTEGRAGELLAQALLSWLRLVKYAGVNLHTWKR